jgi:hypothetical protein
MQDANSVPEGGMVVTQEQLEDQRRPEFASPAQSATRRRSDALGVALCGAPYKAGSGRGRTVS